MLCKITYLLTNQFFISLSNLYTTHYISSLSWDHLSYYRLSGAMSYAGAMEISTFYTLTKWNHIIKFRLVCCHCGLVKRSVEGQNFHRSSVQCTEVGSAFLIHFQKLFLNKVFISIKIAGMNTSGSKSVKKGPKKAEKSHNLELYLVFLNFFWLG